MTNEDVQMHSQPELLYLNKARSRWGKRKQRERIYLFILLIFQMLENKVCALAIITPPMLHFCAQCVERNRIIY